MGLKNSLIETFKGMTFSLSDAYEKFASHYPKEQIRARIYESLGVETIRISLVLGLAINKMLTSLRPVDLISPCSSFPEI